MAPNHASASLLDLPSEVLELVCRSICAHCSRDPLGFDRPRSRRRKARHTDLGSLSATCKHLRSIAFPIFLHDASHFFSRQHMINLLGQRPDLADFVKVLDVSQGRPPIYNAIPTDHQSIARRAFLDPGCELSLENSLEARLNRVASEDDDNKQEGASPKEMYGELLVALCPKVETLTFRCSVYASNLSFSSYMADTALGNLAHRFKQLGSTAGLPSLRALELSKDEKVWTRDSAFGILHPAVSVLLGAAPRLERLGLRWWRGLGQFKTQRALEMKDYEVGLRNLRCLEMYQASIEDDGEGREYEALRQMILCARNLEAFRFSCSTWFHAGFRNHMSPARFLTALEPQKSTLQHLELEISEALDLGERRDPLQLQLHARQLANFTKLHTLTLSENTFCRHCIPRNKLGAAHESHTCLTDILPLTVKTLTVVVCEILSSWKDILHLGRVVAAGDFPALGRVDILVWDDEEWEDFAVEPLLTLETMESRRTELESAFEGSGVELSCMLREDCPWMSADSTSAYIQADGTIV